MAHNIKLKGVADFSGISKEIQALGETVNKTFGKEKKIFDVAEIRKISTQTSTTFAKLSKDFTTLRKEAQVLAKEMKKAGTDEAKISQLIEKRTENLKKQVLLQRDLAALKKVESRVAGAAKDVGGFADVIPIGRGKGGKEPKTFGGMAKQSIYTGAQNVASELPGIAGPVAEVGTGAIKAGSMAAEAGLGVGAIAALGALAVVAGGAVVAISRMKAGFEAFSAIVPEVVKLAGMGVTVAHGGKAVATGAKFGFNEGEVLKLQESENQAFGRAKTPEQDQNRLIKIMGASRLLGINPEQITQGGNQLRAVGGTQMAQREMGLILEKAVASGMDKTQASAYLASAVGLLTQLNDSGTGNTNALLSTMTDLVAKGRMSPEQAARSLSGLQESISGSSGEANAFFQAGAVRGGLGGGSLAGTQFAVRQGLIGIDPAALGNQVGDTAVGRQGLALAEKLGLTGKNFSQQQAGGILEQGQRMAGQNPETYFTFMSKMLNTKNLPDTIKGLALLEKISKASDKKESDRLSRELVDLSKGPEEKWRQDVLNQLTGIQQNTSAKALVTTAIDTGRSEAEARNAQIDLGAQVAPYFNELRDAMTKLDHSLAGLTDAIQHSSFKDLVDGLGTMASRILSVIGEGLTNMVKSVMSPGFWLSDSSASGAISTPLKDQFAEDTHGRDLAYQYFGATKPEDKPGAAPTLPPTKTSGDTGLAEHGPAIVNLLQSIKNNTANKPSAAPRGGRDLSRP